MNAGFLWAFAALQASPGANAHYRRRREHGDWHAAAQRHLLNRFLGHSTTASRPGSTSTNNAPSHHSFQPLHDSAQDDRVAEWLYREKLVHRSPRHGDAPAGATTRRRRADQKRRITRSLSL
jgi:hypothetical protein